MRWYLIIYLFFFANVLFGQSIITSQGTGYSNLSGNVSYTIGELIIETLEDANGILTQGFQQVELLVSGLKSYSNHNVNVYPNPTKDHLQIIFENQHDLYELRILDVGGKEVIKSDIATLKADLDVSYLIHGVYILEITDPIKGPLKKIRFIKVE